MPDYIRLYDSSVHIQNPSLLWHYVCINYCIQISLKGDKPKAKEVKPMDSSSLAEVVARVLDQCIAIDSWVRVSLVGIELLAIIEIIMWL